MPKKCIPVVPRWSRWPSSGWQPVPCWSWWSWLPSGCHHQCYEQHLLYNYFSKVHPCGLQMCRFTRFRFLASYADLVRKSRSPPIWGSSWGQAGSNGTPYATCCLAIRHFPGGGRCSHIYKDTGCIWFLYLLLKTLAHLSARRGKRARLSAWKIPSK